MIVKPKPKKICLFTFDGQLKTALDSACQVSRGYFSSFVNIFTQMTQAM